MRRLYIVWYFAICLLLYLPIINVSKADGNIEKLTETSTTTSPCLGFRTQTQGGWGATPNGNNPGVYLHANFTNAFPNGLTIGCNNTLTFTSAQAITNYLPAGGQPLALPNGATTDPTSSLGVFTSQVIALTLSTTFDTYDVNFGTSTDNLKDLV